MSKRAILIVLDSAGIGALPDAALFGDEHTNTIGNICRVRGRLDVPNMYQLGLSAIEGSTLPPYAGRVTGAYGRAAERTFAKDTTCGHWEMAGLPLEKPFRTYPNGFPAEVMQEFEARIGRGTLGNCSESGTEIIQRLGDEHVNTGKPIVYTSADSVFQIAAHEQIIPLAEQYHICETARKILVGEHLIGRVIARPFLGANGNYYRTENRKDYALEPFSDTILDGLVKRGFQTVCIGKIEDVFCHRGVSMANHTKNNEAGIAATLDTIKQQQGDFVFVNLVDFDMLYGHRNNVEGYAAALEQFDTALGEMQRLLHEDDILIVTADHGCDPTIPGTNHTREYIPVLVAGRRVKPGTCIGTRESFADIGSTVFEYLTGEPWVTGKSFLSEIL